MKTKTLLDYLEEVPFFIAGLAALYFLFCVASVVLFGVSVAEFLGSL